MNLKEAYNQAVTNAQTLINASSNPVMSVNTVNEKAQAVTTAQNNYMVNKNYKKHNIMQTLK